MTGTDIEYLYWCRQCQQLYTFDTEPARHQFLTDHGHGHEQDHAVA